MKKSQEQSIHPLTLIIFVVMIVSALILYFIKKDQIALESTHSLQRLKTYMQQAAPLMEQRSVFPRFSLSAEAVYNKEVGFIASDTEPIRARLSKPKGNGPFPIIVIVHGGKGGDAIATDAIAQLLGERFTRELSVLTVTVDWRNSAYGQGDVVDVTSAIDSIRERFDAEQYPLTVLGIDRGAYIALAAIQKTAKPVAGFMSFYGITHPDEYYRYLQTQNQKQAQQFVLQTGCQHETQPELCLNTLSIKKKTPLRIPALIEHSTMDMVVPIAQSELLAEQFDASMLTWYTPKDSAVTHGFMEQEQATGFEE